VPAGLASDDEGVARQMADLCPWVETAIVQQSPGDQAEECISPSRAPAMIMAAAHRAVARATHGELDVLSQNSGPCEFGVAMRKPIGEAMRENLAGLYGLDIVDDTGTGNSTALFRGADARLQGGLGRRRVPVFTYHRRVPVFTY
jgi:hypothetical protein